MSKKSGAGKKLRALAEAAAAVAAESAPTAASRPAAFEPASFDPAGFEPAPFAPVVEPERAAAAAEPGPTDGPGPGSTDGLGPTDLPVPTDLPGLSGPEVPPAERPILLAPLSAPSLPRDPPPQDPDTALLTARLDRLDHVLAVVRDRSDPAIAASVADSVVTVRERLALGVDHTVVALVGGTGSGKSRLFNAIARLPFAQVGVLRPTTSKVSACVWGGQADSLLDWLEIASDHRLQRESALDGESEAALRGLVLLDLPDHDSIAPEHREVVDRLLPMVDLLVWVVDPQKYADDALHSGYLRRLVGHESAMLVLLNQIDTVPEDTVDVLRADVIHLLREDGLSGVPVEVSSARTGEGIATAREILATVVERHSVSAQRAVAEISDAASRLSTQLASYEPSGADLPVAAVVSGLADAVGLRAIAAAVAATVRTGGSTAPAFGAVQADTADLSRSRWLAHLGTGLPERWQLALGERIASSEEIRSSLAEHLAAVPLRVRHSRLGQVLTVLALVAGLGAVGALGWSMWTRSQVDTTGWMWPRLVIAGALALGALLLAVAARAGRAWSGRKRARAVDVAGRRELEALVEEHLAAPSRALLAEHREARIALGELSARYLSTGIPALEDSTADDVAPIRPA